MALPSDITETVTNTLQTVSDVTGSNKLHDIADRATQYLSAHARDFVNGTVVLVIGLVVTGWIARGVARWLEKRRKLEPPERLLVIVVLRVLLIGLTIIVTMDVSGHPFGAVLGGLGALAVGIGFAIQGLLGNIIAGLTLIFTKPFRVGEYIEILGAQGLVIHIDIISTTLQQLDHSKVVIPNHKIAGEVLRNLGAVRQLHLTLGVGYQTDLKQARHLASVVVKEHPLVLKHPAPLVLVGALRESAIVISIKVWVKIGDYEMAEGELNEALIECYRQNQIELPFPRRDVRILNHEQNETAK